MVHRRLSLLAAVLSLLAPVSGCVTDSTTFFIAGALNAEDSDCMLGPSTTGLPVGTYDPRSNAAYMVPVLLNSQILQRETVSGAASNGIQIKEAEVELLDSSGGQLAAGVPNPFIVDVSAYLPPAVSSDQLGATVAVLPLIPAGAASALSAGSYVVARVTLRGVTQGKLNVESGAWNWTIFIAPGSMEQALGECCNTMEAPELGCFGGSNGGLYCPTYTCPP